MVDDWPAVPLSEVDWEAMLRRISVRSGVTVVIPVFNGGDVVRHCLESVCRHSHGARIVVIDDGSTNPATVALIDEVARTGPVEVVRHDRNWGYTRTANHGMELAGDDDLVLLNSDAVVGPNWLSKLALVAYSEDRVATVTAISDNAGAMAFPRAGVGNTWAPELTWDEIARSVAMRTTTFSQHVPTGHGFCMYIRRAASSAVGAFDVDLFPQGYGEENDFSRRAAAQGFVNLIAPQVFVSHERGASFGTRRAGLIETGIAKVEQRHPDYLDLVQNWLASPQTELLRRESRQIQRRTGTLAGVRPRVLYVIHRANGGTQMTNFDLMQHISEQDSFLLEAVAGQSVELFEIRRGRKHLLESWQPEVGFTITEFWHEAYGGFLARIIASLNIELVHVRHLIAQPFATLPTVLRLLHIPLVLSTHDFYMVCPTVNLVDNNGLHCGGVCTPGDGQCHAGTEFSRGAPSNLKHEWIKTWQEQSLAVLESARTIICTTESAARIHRRVFPSIADRIVLIEHGRDLAVPEETPVRTRQPGPIRILAAANWEPIKGIEYIQQLAAALGDRVEWHFFGSRCERLGDFGIAHGRYARDDFPLIAREVDPDLIAVLATWPETYSHTLAEAWSLGIPVLGNDIGAVADRIRDHGGGLVLPATFGAESVRLLVHHLDTGLREVPKPTAAGVRSVKTMVEDYRTGIYALNPIRDRPVVGVAVFPGRATTHVRVERPSQLAERYGLAAFRTTTPRDIWSGCDTTPYTSYLIQRDAVDPDDADRLVDALQERGTRIVVEMDDDLITPDARASLTDDYSVDRLDALLRVLQRADHAIVSTPGLAQKLAAAGITCPVSVIPNRLDPRLWRLGGAPQASKVPCPVYMGTNTHRGDLDLIAGLPERLSELRGRSTMIDVVGVSAGPLPPGLRRVEIPTSSYPRFVSWLRSERGRWAVGLAPLADTPINSTKSDLKLLDYAALDLVTVASDRGPYAGRHDLADVVDDDLDAWALAVAALMDDAAYRAERLDQASTVLATRLLDRDAVTSWVRLVLDGPAPSRSGAPTPTVGVRDDVTTTFNQEPTQ